MTVRVCLFVLLATPLACTPETLQPGDMGRSGGGGGGGADSPGSAGATTVGTAGDAGSTGAGGSGGLPVCANQDDSYYNLEFTIAGRDGYVLTAPVSAQVTVTDVQSCASTSCEFLYLYDDGHLGADQTTTATAIAVADGANTWTIYLRLPGMPADLVQIGDTLDMTVDAWLETAHGDAFNQSLTLARAGNLVAFASALEAFGPLLLPDLNAFGVALADGGAPCQFSIGCRDQPRRIQATIPTATAAIAAGETATVGDISITNGRTIVFGETDCEWKNRTQVGGFRAP